MFKDGIYFGGANGKGMTKEYALASGHAELYERFCNKIMFLTNPLWTRKFMEINQAEHGYYFSPDERILSYEELFKNPRSEVYFKKVSGYSPKLLRSMIKFITNGTYVGVPLYNIADHSDVSYIDPRMLMLITRSNGMAAGNTLNEALVQAISELVERDAADRILYQDIKAPHYAIDLEKIEDVHLKEVINKIKALGYKFYMFDLSYNYNIPVMMSLLIDNKDGSIRINFGSFPVFEIAAERVLTELYQGIQSFSGKNWACQTQTPYKSVSEEFMRGVYGNSINGTIFPAEFFNSIEYVDTYNHNGYMPKESSNEDLIEYYKRLSKYLNIKIYYINTSLMDNLYAVNTLIVPNDDYHTYSILNGRNYDQDDISIPKCITAIEGLYNTLNNLYEHKPIKFSDYINTILAYNSDQIVFRTIDSLLLWHHIFMESREQSFGPFTQLLNIDAVSDNIPDDVLNTELYRSYKKYIQLARYVNSNKYSFDELLHIFNEIFDYKITEEDIVKCQSPAYLLQKIYIEPMQEYLNSDTLYELIKTYTDNYHR